MIDERWAKARRILAIRLDNLGDVLVTTPALHAIKTSLPNAELTLLASPIGAQVAHLNPDLDDVIVYSAPWMDPWHKLPLDSQREQHMIATLRERQFDGAIIFTSFRQSPLPAAYLCYLADIPLRVAASIDGPGSLLTTRHKHPERMMHEVERGLDLVAAIGLTTDERDLVLQVPEEARHAVDTLLAELSINRARPLLVVHPGCSMPARTYPWEMYAQVINLVIAQLDAIVLLTGAQDEQELVKRIIENVREDVRHSIHSMAGLLSFPELCAMIQAADVTITNNTGPMHIAAAVKTPVVALFALTNPPEQWGPWHVPHRLLNVDVPCRICYSRVCPYHHECLRLVTPGMVVKATSELLTDVTPAPTARVPVKGYPYHGPTNLRSRSVHGRGTPRGYPGGGGRGYGGKHMNEWLAAKNILAMRLDNIGDVIMLGPALRAIKETSPQARLTLLASSAGSTAAPLLPWIDDVITWRTIWQDVGNRIPLDPARERQLIELLAERQFDAALVFTSFSQTPHTPGYVCYLAGIPLRAGESKEFGGSTLTTELRGAPEDLHQVERNLRLIEHLGFVVRERRLTVALPAEARQAVPTLLQQAGLHPQQPYLLLHPGASAQARRYPVERFGVIARLLSCRGWPVLVTGVEREAALLEELQVHAPSIHCLLSGTSLAGYAALVERAALVICNDTLPMHLADAVRTPAVVLFSGTDYEEQWRPRTTLHRLLRRSTSCYPCYLFECPIGQTCLNIAPEEVVEEIETLLAEIGVSPVVCQEPARRTPQ